jgi:hypothetical protein
MIINKSYQSVISFWNSTENGSTMHHYSWIFDLFDNGMCILLFFLLSLNEFQTSALGQHIYGKPWVILIKTLMITIILLFDFQSAFIGMIDICFGVLV